jgi:hypothetical protein
MTRAGRRWLPVFAVAAALGIAACGGGGSSGDNGVAAKSPDQILAAAIAQARTAGSMRVTGTTAADDVVIVRGKGASGSLSSNGERIRLVVTSDTAYLNANRTFWQQVQPAEVGLADHWVRLPGGVSAVAQLKDVSFTGLIATLSDEHGKVSKGARTTVAGQKVVALKLGGGGTVYVATTGKPYLVATRGGTLGDATFSHWGSSFSITPPQGAESPQQLLGG